MQVNWFPGHMNKARRELAAAMRETDVVLEILDARLPAASQNPLLAKLRAGKPCIVILNKSDLADPVVTERWLAVFTGQPDTRSFALSAKCAAEVRLLVGQCRELVPGRGVPGKSVRAMIVGIPNVGKSTLLNALKGRRIAEVGDKPAVTRHRQRIDLDGHVCVWDTPGVLWPKLEDQRAAFRLAASGAIADAAHDPTEVALFAIDEIRTRYPDALCQRYGLSLADSTEAGSPDAVLEAIGRRRGCIRRGNEVDRARASELVLRELRSGKLGRISLEEPDS